MGLNTFEQIRQPEDKNDSVKSQNLFYITVPRDANGKQKTTSEGFVVFENSQIAEPVTQSYPKAMQKI